MPEQAALLLRTRARQAKAMALAARLTATLLIVTGVILAGLLPAWVGPLATMTAAPLLFVCWFAR